MAGVSTQCHVCGCGLDRDDVRQLAVYYREDQPSLVAVQYHCPRCGAAEWRRWEPSEVAGDRVLEQDLTGLARVLGMSQRRVEESHRSPVPATAGLAGCDLMSPISLDETIEFARRVTHLGPSDLRALHESVA